MVLHCDFYSVVLRRNTHINVILPTPGEPGQKVQQDMKVPYEEGCLKEVTTAIADWIRANAQ